MWRPRRVRKRPRTTGGGWTVAADLSSFAAMRALTALLVVLAGCSPAASTDAPYAAAARQPGPCGSTEALLPKLFDFLAADRFASFREVIEEELLNADPREAPATLRGSVRAFLSLFAQLGVERAQVLLSLTRDDRVEAELSLILTALLRIIDGREDGRSRYEVAEATGRFLRTCASDPLLSALEALLRLRVEGDPNRAWLSALVIELDGLLADETVGPLLESFQSQDGEASGRPAVVGLLAQVMLFLAEEPDPVPRVRTLLESALYPLVELPLRSRIERLVDLLGEATQPDAGVLAGLQGALRCGNRQREARDVLLGFVYDLVVDDSLGVEGILRTASIVRETTLSELELLADLLGLLRRDESARDELIGLLVVLLEPNSARRVVPVLLDMAEQGVVAEMIDALALLISRDCEVDS